MATLSTDILTLLKQFKESKEMRWDEMKLRIREMKFKLHRWLGQGELKCLLEVTAKKRMFDLHQTHWKERRNR